MRFTLELLVKRECNVRLANPRLPCKYYHAAALLHGLSPLAQQRLYLFSTPEQRRHAALMHRLEATLHAAAPQHLPNRHRLRPAFHRARAEIAIIEVAPSESVRIRIDQHRTGLGKRLQARSEVRRLTNDRLLTHSAVSDQITHDNHSGGNANANL